jgi:hypothetical protein
MELVDANTLATWLTEQIQRHEGCDRCKIVQVYKSLDAEDRDCNWRIGVFVRRNPDEEACQKNLSRVRQLAEEQFNLV